MRSGSSLLIDLLTCLRFATRIPLPVFAFEAATPRDFSDFGRALRLLPLAGALIGLMAGAVLAAASALGLAPLLAAPLSVAALIAASGGLHEDGLADCADAAGGATRARKLEIMADSRIGAFGALALGLSLFIRIVALAALAERSLFLAGTVLIGAAAAARAAALIPLSVLPPARSSGAGFSAGRLRASSLVVAMMLGAGFAALTIFAGANPLRPALALAACVLAGLAASALARGALGGQTGDVAGAAEQMAEVLFYLVFAAAI
ncbi:adenosylcobinamide-GDP ribazoletransferase [Methylocella silvestris]|uniref:Adenosylcobinamide-GDP ribazoletransferase n=1 Tax=Methylocella silvestris TaxID=199596 RepID=A0A2J7TK16_METSI|nr:adenosylcobinamide-GDP ribazoletransferase [Methylocella silvestris]PNG27106.1 adenosylcobinamide-GDP ribazoletransferase [Methylocella silvestris]